jgi:hypothetical protein
MATRAFEDYRLHAVRLSRMELDALRSMLKGQEVQIEEMSKREWESFSRKINFNKNK